MDSWLQVGENCVVVDSETKFCWKKTETVKGPISLNAILLCGNHHLVSYWKELKYLDIFLLQAVVCGERLYWHSHLKLATLDLSIQIWCNAVLPSLTRWNTSPSLRSNYLHCGCWCCCWKVARREGWTRLYHPCTPHNLDYRISLNHWLEISKVLLISYRLRINVVLRNWLTMKSKSTNSNCFFSYDLMLHHLLHMTLLSCNWLDCSF